MTTAKNAHCISDVMNQIKNNPLDKKKTKTQTQDRQEKKTKQ
jgi:hypothetical protein